MITKDNCRQISNGFCPNIISFKLAILISKIFLITVLLQRQRHIQLVSTAVSYHGRCLTLSCNASWHRDL